MQKVQGVDAPAKSMIAAP